MKNLRVVLLTSLIAFSCFSAFAANSLPGPQKTPVQTLDLIVAKVNSDIITQSELSQAISKAKIQLHAAGNAVPSNAALKKQVLRQLIYQKLQLNLAKTNNMSVSNEQLEQAVTKIAQQNGISVAVMKTKIQAQGLNYKTYLHDLKQQILLSNLQQEAVRQSINITPEDITAMKKKLANNPKKIEYHLANITVALPSSPTTRDIQTAKKSADTLYQKVANGANFNAIATANSSSSKALSTNSLGWRLLPEWPDVYINAIKNLKPNQTVSKPFRTGNGFQIIKVLGTRADKAGQLSDQQIEQMLYQQKFGEELNAWLQKLYYSAYIKIY